MTYLELERQLRKNNAGHNHSRPIGYFDNCTQDCLDLNRPSL